jgi:hypothetical protein
MSVTRYSPPCTKGKAFAFFLLVCKSQEIAQKGMISPIHFYLCCSSSLLSFIKNPGLPNCESTTKLVDNASQNVLEILFSTYFLCQREGERERERERAG